MSSRNTHLLEIFWRRTGIFGTEIKDVLRIRCEEFEIDSIIKDKLEKCVSEGYGRVIDKIDIYRSSLIETIKPNN